jgi:hypothetical protein
MCTFNKLLAKNKRSKKDNSDPNLALSFQKSESESELKQWPSAGCQPSVGGVRCEGRCCTPASARGPRRRRCRRRRSPSRLERARERRCRPCALTEAASVLWLPSVGNRRRGARAQPRRRRRAIKGAYARPDSLHTETAPKVSRLCRLSFVSLCVSVAFTPSARSEIEIALVLFCERRASFYCG